MSQSGQELGETATTRQHLGRDGTSDDTVGDTPPTSTSSRNNKRRRIIMENEALVLGYNSYATPVDHEVGYKKGGR